MAKSQPMTTEAPHIQISGLLDVDSVQADCTIMIYGKNGCGKTPLSAGAPRPLFLDFGEKGVRSARGVGAKCVLIKSWAQLEALYWELTDIPRDKSPFRTIIWDTLSGAATLAMHQILNIQAKKKNLPPPGDISGEKGEWPAHAEIQHWGILEAVMRDMLLRFKVLPYHLVLNALDKSLNDKEVKAFGVQYGPSLSHKVSESICALADVIGYLYSVNSGKDAGKYLLCGPNDVYMARARGGLLPQLIKNPDMGKIIKILEEGK